MIPLDRVPAKNDPRLPVLLLQFTFVFCGITFWGFNRSPAQVGLILAVCVALDCTLHYLLRKKTLLVPISGLITGLGLSVLTNFSHGLWLALVPPLFVHAACRPDNHIVKVAAPCTDDEEDDSKKGR